MSSDLERYQPRDVVDGWTGVMGDVVKLADYVSTTDFVPKALRGKPAAIAAAILAGREAGIPPMRALSHVHMVDGRPSMSAEQKRAQALAAGHDIVYVETTTERCVVKGRRTGSDQWSTVTWSKDDAKAAGLLGKDNWRKWPRRMLQARATGELCDMLFPDATAGLATTEELQDDTDAAGIATDAGPQTAKRTARRRTTVTATRAPAPAPEPAAAATPAAPLPPLPGEDGYDDEPPADPEPTASTQPHVTQPQLRKIHALFGDVDWKERDDRLYAASAIVGRTLSSSNDLTRDEAKALIDTLERVAAGPDPAKRLGELVTETMGGDVVDGEVVDDGGTQ